MTIKIDNASLARLYETFVANNELFTLPAERYALRQIGYRDDMTSEELDEFYSTQTSDKFDKLKSEFIGQMLHELFLIETNAARYDAVMNNHTIEKAI